MNQPSSGTPSKARSETVCQAAPAGEVYGRGALHVQGELAEHRQRREVAGERHYNQRRDCDEP